MTDYPFYLPFLIYYFFFCSLQLNLLYQSVSLCLSVSPSIALSEHHGCGYLHICLYYMYISVRQSFFLSIHLFLTIILAVSSSVCLSVYLSVFLSVHLSVFLSVLHPPSLMTSWCLSVCLLICFSNRNSGKVTPKTRFPAFVSFPINFMQPLPSLLQILSLASLFVLN